MGEWMLKVMNRFFVVRLDQGRFVVGDSFAMYSDAVREAEHKSGLELGTSYFVFEARMRCVTEHKTEKV
jgi:hypothetical protein